MISELDIEDYIEQNLPLIPLMCNPQLWDGLTESKVTEWLQNFHDSLGQYFALKILLNSLYYSEDDIITLLKYCLFEKIYSMELQKEIIGNKKISETPSVGSSEVKLKCSKTLFIPLLHKNKPHESGTQIIRYLTQSLQIKSGQTFFHWDVKADDIAKNTTLVIVDDCIGSGKQIVQYWNSDQLKEIKETAQRCGIKCYYLVLVAYKDQLDIIEPLLPDLEIITCDLLTNKHRVFSDESIYFSSKELDDAKEYFKKLEEERSIPMYGFDGLDFAIIIHRNIPDWSLPIFWKKTLDWNILLPRKNSYL